MDRLIWLEGVDLTTGETIRRNQQDVDYGYRRTDLNANTLIVDASFGLVEDAPDVIAARMDEMLAERKASQPLWNRNAGCIFKNPEGTSAGLLIDQAGCKGETSGGATVSSLHANFIVNTEDATAEDVLALIDRVRDRVVKVHGVTLETEVRIVGERGLENA